jgi:YVTN family beta-propeller protein
MMINVRRLLRNASLVLTLSLTAAWGSTVRVYVTNFAGDSIDIIEPASNQVVQQIQGMKGAHGIGFSSDGSRVYASDELDSTLDVFDRETGALVKKVPLSGRPNNIAVSKDGRIVIGIAQDPGALDIIDPRTLTRTNSVPVNGWLHNVYVTPDSKYVVTGSPATGIITIIDLATEKPVWEVKLDRGIRPMAVEAGADGSAKRIFVQLTGFHGFAVVEFAARKEVARIELPERKTKLEFGPKAESSTRLRLTPGDATNAPSHGIGVAPDGMTLWVASTRNNAVYAYSLKDLNPVGEVALPSIKLPDHEPISSFPNWVTFTPDSSTIYVSNSNMRSVSAIDTKLMKLIAVISVGDVPKRINTLAIAN